MHFCHWNCGATQVVLAGRIGLLILVALVIALVTALASLAFWYRLPFPDWARALCAAVFMALGVAALFSTFSRRLRFSTGLFVAAFCATLIWWSTIKPVDGSYWAPDVSRQVTGWVADNVLTLTNIRDFEWHRPTDFAERWVTRGYDLAKAPHA